MCISLRQPQAVRERWGRSCRWHYLQPRFHRVQKVKKPEIEIVAVSPQSASPLIAAQSVSSVQGQGAQDPASRLHLTVGKALSIGLAVAVFILLVWALGEILLLIFAGILVAAVLDAAVRQIPGPGRSWKLGFVVVGAAAGFGAAAYWAGATIVGQFQALEKAIVEQITQLGRALDDMDLPLDIFEDPEQFAAIAPDNAAILDIAGDAFWTASGVAMNGLTIFLLGVFLAISPTRYLKGLVILVQPARRSRTAEVLTKAGRALQAWLVGQLVAMLIVGISIFGLLSVFGVPNAIALAGVTALLNFIPFLGPILAAFPVGMVALMQGNTTFLFVMGAFVVIQWIEGYLLTPLIQQRAVDLPPAHSLAFLMIMGALFGELGVALATPLLAVIRVLVLHLYVEDVLGGTQGREPVEGSD